MISVINYIDGEWAQSKGFGTSAWIPFIIIASSPRKSSSLLHQSPTHDLHHEISTFILSISIVQSLPKNTRPIITLAAYLVWIQNRKRIELWNVLYRRSDPWVLGVFELYTRITYHWSGKKKYQVFIPRIMACRSDSSGSHQHAISSWPHLGSQSPPIISDTLR